MHILIYSAEAVLATSMKWLPSKSKTCWYSQFWLFSLMIINGWYVEVFQNVVTLTPWICLWKEFCSVFLFFTQVTGYVLIANVFVKNVTLTSLTLIRGDTLFKPPVQVRINGTNTTRNSQKQSKGYALFVSLNFKASSNAIGMRLLGLSSLTGREIFKFLI